MPELSDDTNIFRIYSFFDLINTLYQGKIRLSQASRMEDQNELFGIYFDLFKSDFGPYSKESIPDIQTKFREAQSHHYLSCWTQTKDNIALWSLYSPNFDGIQVCITYGSLKTSIIQYWEQNGTHVSYSLPPNDPRDLFFVPQIGPVEYVDFEKEYQEILDCYDEYSQEKEQFFEASRQSQALSANEESSDGLGKDVQKWVKTSAALRKRIFGQPKFKSSLLKDYRYSHEQEVRFVLSLYRRDGRSKEEYENHPMAGLDDPCRHPKPSDCPSNIHVPFAPENFISFEVDGANA